MEDLTLFYSLSYVMHTVDKKKDIIPVIHMYDKISFHHSPSLPPPLPAVITDQTSSPTTNPDL